MIVLKNAYKKPETERSNTPIALLLQHRLSITNSTKAIDKTNHHLMAIPAIKMHLNIVH